ncbi:hypothetical protein [Mesorhizobium sp. KR9-304]|uniref:hypothetical protein n=1 Tax=Mesorhizobium sp. KR9-304 TaxID=3156614 RepID=UPI0032B3B051
MPKTQLAHAVTIGHLQQLVATIREARGIDAALILNSDVPLANFPLGDGATIASVRNDGECVEESLYLKTVNNRAPLMLAAADVAKVDPDLCEYRLPVAAPLYPGEAAPGLGFAHLFDGLGLSLASHNFWLAQSIELDLATFDSVGELVTTQVVARNADRPATIVSHSAALRALLAPAIADGAELWERRAELLPNLAFIPRTRAQLQGILAGDPMLEQAWVKLRGIDQAIEAWKIVQGAHPMFPFNVRPESKSRRGLAEFQDADGNPRIFSDHCDLAPTEARIHFVVEVNPERRALIGHVGRKLGIG